MSEPAVDEKPIPSGILNYFRTRNKMRAVDVVYQEFERSGITQAQLAARLGMDLDGVARMLSNPHNWSLDTLSDLLFAISGAVLKYELGSPYPLREVGDEAGED